MGARFLIDTNVTIDLLERRLPTPGAAWLMQTVAAGKAAHSIINRIELLSVPAASLTLQAVLALWLNDVHELALDAVVAQETIRIRQLHRRKLPDAVIAASALVHNLTLVTRNTADFRALTGLPLLNLHDASELPLI